MRPPDPDDPKIAAFLRAASQRIAAMMRAQALTCRQPHLSSSLEWPLSTLPLIRATTLSTTLRVVGS